MNSVRLVLNDKGLKSNILDSNKEQNGLVSYYPEDEVVLFLPENRPGIRGKDGIRIPYDCIKGIHRIRRDKSVDINENLFARHLELHKHSKR